MTAQERTVGPPPISSSSSLLNRLQRTSNSASSAAPQATPLEPAQSVFGQQHQAEAQGGPKEATSQHAMPQPSSQAQPVIVTPINMQARANSKGPGPQSSNAGKPLILLLQGVTLQESLGTGKSCHLQHT